MNTAAPTAAPGWDGILDPGEKIVWQDRPDARISFAGRAPMQMIMGVFFTGFALFWIVQASWITSHDGFPAFARFFPLFGIPFVLVGLKMLGGDALWAAFVRRHTWYTLTNRRAFIATNVPMRGRTLKSYDIVPETDIEFDGRDPGTLIFAYETRRGTARKPVGFIRIPDARSVLAQMHEIRKRQMS